MWTQTHGLFHNGCTAWDIFLEKKSFSVATYLFKGGNTSILCTTVTASGRQKGT